MYIPAHNEETDISVMHALIRAYPLGAWVTPADGELLANHLPFLLDPGRGECGTLVTHVARANRVWRCFSPTVPSVVIFQGPQAYITPSWYVAKRTHGMVVPTWNYAVVHAHGVPRIIEDRQWLRYHVTQLTETNERGEAAPWSVSDAPAHFIDQMLAEIIGIEIRIDRLVGKWKVSQNRPAADRSAVAEGLRARADDESTQMARLVARLDAEPPAP